jgi:hypothetical protein
LHDSSFVGKAVDGDGRRRVPGIVAVLGLYLTIALSDAAAMGSALLRL